MAREHEWTIADLQMLHGLYHGGYGTAEIAMRLGRSEEEVSSIIRLLSSDEIRAGGRADPRNRHD